MPIRNEVDDLVGMMELGQFGNLAMTPGLYTVYVYLFIFNEKLDLPILILI